MTLPSALASRMVAPFGDGASTVFRATLLLKMPSVGSIVAVRLGRSMRSTACGPLAERTAARMALPEAASERG